MSHPRAHLRRLLLVAGCVAVVASLPASAPAAKRKAKTPPKPSVTVKAPAPVAVFGVGRKGH
jgi:hypothetical protein